MSEETYISRQISVIKTKNRLIETIERLNPAPLENYAHLHAQGDGGDGFRVYSLIRVNMVDYSNGNGNNKISVYFNILPSQARFIHSRITAGFFEFQFSQDKIFGEPDQQGQSSVTKIAIWRSNDAMPDGKPRNYPWTVKIENGVGVAAHNDLGGTYIQKGSYKKIFEVSMSLSDMDMFKLMDDTVRFLDIWESLYGPDLVARGITERQARKTAHTEQKAVAA